MSGTTFVPGGVRWEGPMASEYDAGRALTERARTVWRDAAAPYLDGAARILDVGSGTGRFTALLADWFGAAVVGVEPAAEMRREAASRARHPRAAVVGGRAERLPIRDGWASAAWLSGVFHHVEDSPACVAELRRVLRRGGRVLLRGAFSGRLDGISLFDHFPEARVVCEAFPTLEETVEIFRAGGFAFEAVAPVTQETCVGLEELAARTRTRADTTLALMTDEAFAARQAALEAKAAAEAAPAPVLDTYDLLVLRRSDQ